ncbi:MAG TPA: alpha/beta hydrolase [Stenotrophomonas sp.]|jgi:acetyl esterase/lipase
MKQLLAGIWLLIVSATCQAAVTGSAPLLDPQNRPWQAAPPAEQVTLWPAEMELAPPATPGAETYGTSRGKIADREVTMVQHVSRPTMSIYRPTTDNTGVAVVVFPGGGYRVLAIDLEGTEVCDWLVSKGITCVLLKYRVPGSGPYWADECNCRRIPSVPMALQDAQRAISLLRERAATLGVDPHRIGVIGFSAGGRMVADVSNAPAPTYAAIDAADRQSSRPDFAIALYPGHLWKKPGLTLDPAVTINPHCPPTLLIQAGNDPTDDVRHSLTYYLALQQAKIPVELHLYAEGGHAFGLRPSPHPVSGWPALTETWLRTIRVLPGVAQAAQANADR